MIQEWIKKIGDIINLQKIEEAKELQIAAWNFKSVDYPPLIIDFSSPIQWPAFSYEEIFNNKDKMLIQQLGIVYPHCLIQDDSVPGIRANYGLVVIPSAFGCEIEIPREGMPWIKKRPLEEEPLNLDKIAYPMINEGLMKKVLETNEYFSKILNNTGVRVFLSDTQGPLNIAYSLMGNKLFTSFYKNSEFLKKLLDIISDVYIEFSLAQKEIIKEPITQGVHGWDGDEGPFGIWMDKGGVRIADDVAVMVSPKIYKEFVIPYIRKCLRPFDGGMLHICGNANHLLHEIVSIPEVKAVHFGNPEMFNLKNLIDLFHKKACIIWTDKPKRKKLDVWVKEIVNILGGCTTGIIFSTKVSNYKDAKELLSKWKLEFRR
ncbi:MAG: uroporphyrinogen decarboxylase family protein [Candidatus Aenigmatarchaeota archaeon]